MNSKYKDIMVFFRDGVTARVGACVYVFPVVGRVNYILVRGTVTIKVTQISASVISIKLDLCSC